MRLELDQPRTLGELVALTFELFGRHLATFLTLTLIVVAPAVILVDGVWGGYLADGGNAEPSAGASWASFALATLVIPALVTALQVVAVHALAEGEEPTVGAALRRAAPRLPAAAGAVVLYSLGVALGLVALIVPGIWLSVRWYFAAQAAVVDGLRPVDALRRSAEVVETRWWRTLGVLLGFGPAHRHLRGCGRPGDRDHRQRRDLHVGSDPAPGRAAVVDGHLRDAAVLRFARPRSHLVARVSQLPRLPILGWSGSPEKEWL